MSRHESALALRVPTNRIGKIVEAERNVSPDAALRLGRYFATGPEFWINLQARYDLEFSDRIEREVLPPLRSVKMCL